jgi:L-lactate dehydrogenase (cytochrome)
MESAMLLQRRDMRLQDFAQLAQRPARPAHPVDAWLNIEDAQTAARKRLPKSIYEYLEGGAENEASLRRNQAAYEEWRLVPRWGAVEGPDLSIDIFGGKSGLPLFLSPTGGSRLFHPDGEVATLTAAAQAGIPFGLAGLSNTRMEDVSAAAPHSRRWFNLELSPDKGFLQAMLDRIQNAGYEGIIINLDCRVIGHRERDYRNGFSVPPSLRMKNHRRWCCPSALVFEVHQQRRHRFPKPHPGRPRGKPCEHTRDVARAPLRYLSGEGLVKPRGSAPPLDRPNHP